MVNLLLKLFLRREKCDLCISLAEAERFQRPKRGFPTGFSYREVDVLAM